MKNFATWLPAAALFTAGLALMCAPGIRFSGYLCFGMAGLWVLWRLLRRWAERSKVGKRCKAIFLVGVLAAVLALVCMEGVIIAHGEAPESVETVDAVLILGAGVNGETPSLTLQTRINAAADYLEKHPGVPVVLSGGQGPGENITEAECMRRELSRRLADAAPELLTEERSTSTAENFAFSKEILQQYGVDTDTAVIGVVTNDFHMFRAELIAKREGLTVVAIPAELPWWWLTANYYAREAFALVKTLIFD